MLNSQYVKWTSVARNEICNELMGAVKELPKVAVKDRTLFGVKATLGSPNNPKDYLGYCGVKEASPVKELPKLRLGASYFPPLSLSCGFCDRKRGRCPLFA